MDTGAIDGKGGTDVLISGGVPGAQALQPCSTNSDCKAGVCGPEAHVCFACLGNADCGAGFACIKHACVASTVCKSGADCKASKKVCDKTHGVCVDCTVSADCGADQECVQAKCVAAPKCQSDKDCPAVCDLGKGMCVGCVANVDCPNGQFCAPWQACEAAVCSGQACLQATLFICAPDGSGYGAMPCSDGNPCTDDGCDLVKGSGCQYGFNTTPCSDGQECTTGDVCTAGLCKGSAPASVCGDGLCNGCENAAGCAKDCVCADDGDLLLMIDDGGVAKKVCVHDYPAWGIPNGTGGSLKDSGDGTVSDSFTGLHWQKAAEVTGFTWAGAAKHCDSLVLAGKGDWRLPSQAELETLIDDTKMQPAIYAVFSDTLEHLFWSATPMVAGGDAWFISFYTGGGYHHNISFTNRVRCVR